MWDMLYVSPHKLPYLAHICDPSHGRWASPPRVAANLCSHTHMANIGPPIRAPSIFVCVVCLKTFRIGLSNFAYLFHIIHNISNTCQSVWLTFPSHSRLPHFQGNISKPKTSKQPKVCLEKKLIFCFELKEKKTGLQYLQTKQTATRLFETGKFVQVQKLSDIKIWVIGCNDGNIPLQKFNSVWKSRSDW